MVHVWEQKHVEWTELQPEAYQRRRQQQLQLSAHFRQSESPNLCAEALAQHWEQRQSQKQQQQQQQQQQ